VVNTILLLPPVLHDLFQNGRQGLDPPVADGLPAYFHDRHIRIQAAAGVRFPVVDKFLAHQALAHEPAFDMQPFTVLVPDQCHGFSFKIKVGPFRSAGVRQPV
jgi:hypothetical protein